MKRSLLLILPFCFLMIGCTQNEPNITGYVMDKNDESVLIVSNHSADYGSTGSSEGFYDAVTASNALDEVKIGDLVEVWYADGVRETYPAQATIGTLNVIPSEQPEGADLTKSEVLDKILPQYSPENHPLGVKSIYYDENQDTWSIILRSLFDEVDYSHKILDE
ncbi:DUF3221 domain-containing protein [Marinilactibacillus sp. XAAS-LB27]|uniref:DUF3221 domain-containing protein n=1 Tax=Marinilactibacillus sp. XAAS-LB27 TaxID=3114538 RepID=UPI002E175D4A|nr:DUF3221 domain-containing protein [Marinilactibacillus sp. XAAS-LB27]